MSKKVTYNNNTPLNEAQKQNRKEILSTELPPGFFKKNPEFGVKPIDGGRFNSATGEVGLVLGGVAVVGSVLNGISSANNPNAVSKIGHQSTSLNHITSTTPNSLPKEQNFKLPKKVKRSVDPTKNDHVTESSVDSAKNNHVTKSSVDSTKNDHVTESSVDSAEDDHVAEGNELFIISNFNIPNISKKITENPAVTKLFVNRTPIKCTNLPSLKKMLEDNPQITELNFESNKMGNQGTIELIKALKGTNIKKLGVLYNEITSEGASEIGKAVAGTKITHLSLHGNFLKGEGTLNLLEALAGTNVNTLNLDFNWIKGEEIIKEILPYLKKCSNITELTLYHNYIEEHLSKKIFYAVKENRENIDNKSTTTEKGFIATEENSTHTNVTEKNSTHTNEEPIPESHTASKVETTPLLKTLWWTLGGVGVFGFVGFAAIIACFCTEDDNDIAMIDMPTNIPQGGVTVYTRKAYLEACPQNEYNPIYGIASATTKPLPTTPLIKDVVAVEDGIYDQCGNVIYVIEEESRNEPNLEMGRNTTANESIYLNMIGNTIAIELQEESRNESIYLDMGGNTTAIGLHTEVESCC
ncbi:MAG: hypothetical protein LN563_01840 [Rickettsia endosymbiont of Platyusa sonomae]|nr:hypothetical protein [Rickettsia endosymbiont of Platyusa sonomae]